eukprot:scaffold85266_cov33-Tisochrysis_lutea.AAC.4
MTCALQIGVGHTEVDEGPQSRSPCNVRGKGQGLSCGALLAPLVRFERPSALLHASRTILYGQYI